MLSVLSRSIATTFQMISLTLESEYLICLIDFEPIPV